MQIYPKPVFTLYAQGRRVAIAHILRDKGFDSECDEFLNHCRPVDDIEGSDDYGCVILNDINHLVDLSAAFSGRDVMLSLVCRGGDRKAGFEAVFGDDHNGNHNRTHATWFADTSQYQQAITEAAQDAVDRLRQALDEGVNPQ